MSELLIRAGTVDDIKAIQAIYKYYVEETVITFEEKVPDRDEIRQRFLDITETHRMPYLVGEYQGRVVGYAYASVFRSRAAFKYSTEHSIYLEHTLRGMGLGTKLMEALINACEPKGLRQMIAVISDEINGASVNLHKKAGFKLIGVMPATGYKFNRWIDCIIMQRPIGDGDKNAPDGQGLNLN